MKVCPWAENLRPTSSNIGNPFTVFTSWVKKCCHLSCQKTRVRGARLKTDKGKEEIAQLSEKDGSCVFLFTGDRSKTDESGSREIKVQEKGEQGTGRGTF